MLSFDQLTEDRLSGPTVSPGPCSDLAGGCKAVASPGCDHPVMTTVTSSPAIDHFLARIRGEHDGPSPWARGAVLDAVVPGWRFSVCGDEAIRRQIRAWFRDPGTLEELRRHSIAAGEVIELSVSWVEDGVPHAARQIHVLELDPDGHIARHDMWCGGRWPATLLAEMEAGSDAG